MTTPNVNSRQVGGAHYRSEHQHWDFVAEVLEGRYLEGCITKYVTRWRNKDGLKDLNKALHYTEKLLSQYELGRSVPLMAPGDDYAEKNPLIQRFLDANEITGSDEEFVVRVTSQWQGPGDLINAIKAISNLIEFAKTQHGALGRVNTVYQSQGFAFEGVSGNDKIHWQCEVCQSHVTTQDHRAEGSFELPKCQHVGTIYEDGGQRKSVFGPENDGEKKLTAGEKEERDYLDR